VTVKVEADGCLYHVFGENRKTKRAFHRYAVNLCAFDRIALGPDDAFPTGDAAADAETAALLDVHLARATQGFEGLFDPDDAADDDEIDLRFYFPSERVADHYFVRRPDGTLVLRLVFRAAENRAAAEEMVPGVCDWIASLPLAAGLVRAEPGDRRGCGFAASDPEGNDTAEIRVAVEQLPDGRWEVVAEIVPPPDRPRAP